MNLDMDGAEIVLAFGTNSEMIALLVTVTVIAAMHPIVVQEASLSTDCGQVIRISLLDSGVHVFCGETNVYLKG